MPSQSVSISGLDEFNAFIRLLAPALKDVFFKVGEEYANIMYSTMRSVVPVRTGYLKSTIGKSSSTTEIMVYVDAEYAGYVNFGTSRQRAQPYFTNTVQQFTPEFEKAFDAETGKAISKNTGG